MRDRDRIVHSKAFRRLKHKTQVFFSPEGDHYRTRLTHTLEVTQIGRTIARALRLNEDLVEAIGLGHDLGHTPFGHTGEYVLKELSPYGFSHYEQSVRVCELLEGNGGLNLSAEVLDGILNHSGSNMASTLEGQVIKFADRIAYTNHDIDDAMRAGVLKIEELPQEAIKILGQTHSKRINRLIMSIINVSSGENHVKMEPEVGVAFETLRRYMYDHVYSHSDAKVEEKKIENVIKALYKYYLVHEEEIPDLHDPRREVRVCDYIAGMTDNYCVHVYKNLFVPKNWEY